jgi:hypothetical protein
MNVSSPDWVRTDRAEAELASMTAELRAARPEPIPLPVLADTVIELIRADDRSGHVVVLRPDQPPPSRTRSSPHRRRRADTQGDDPTSSDAAPTTLLTSERTTSAITPHGELIDHERTSSVCRDHRRRPR